MKRAIAILMLSSLTACASATPRLSESDRLALNAMAVAVHQNIQQ